MQVEEATESFQAVQEREPCSQCGRSCGRFEWSLHEACSLKVSIGPGWVRGCRQSRDEHAAVCTRSLGS